VCTFRASALREKLFLNFGFVISTAKSVLSLTWTKVDSSNYFIKINTFESGR